MRQLIFIVTLIFCCVSIFADTYIVNTAKLNVRSEASKKSQVKYQLAKNDTIEVVSYDEAREWGKIETPKGEGWVSLSLLTQIEIQEAETENTTISRKIKLLRWAYWLSVLFSLIGLLEIILLSKEAWLRDRLTALIFEVGLPFLLCCCIAIANMSTDLVADKFKMGILLILLPSSISILTFYPFLFTDWGKKKVETISLTINSIMCWGLLIGIFISANELNGLDYVLEIIIRGVIIIVPNFFAFVFLALLPVDSICEHCGVYCAQETLDSKILARRKETYKTYSKELDYRTAEIEGDHILVTEYYRDKVETKEKRYKLIETTKLCSCCGHIKNEQQWVESPF
ncbi:MAG: SH3 domain-containing protein [Paludibacteraceae bacterium]|nr:SH3 domain-containing protein [Paludibacteraceae bacterium]